MNRRQLQRRRTKAMIYSFNHSKQYRYYWWPKLMKKVMAAFREQIIHELYERPNPMYDALKKSQRSPSADSREVISMRNNRWT